MTAMSSSSRWREARLDPADELSGGPRRPIALRSSMPLEDVGLELVAGPEERGRPLDEPEEHRRPQAQVRGDDGSGAVRSQIRLDGLPLAVPTRRRDHDPAAAGRESGRDVVANGLRPRRLDHQVWRAEGRRIVTAVRRAPEQPYLGAAGDEGRGDRLSQRPVAKNDRVHRGTSLLHRCGSRAAVPEATKKPRSPMWCPRPLEPPIPEALSVVVCARRQSPRTRASRQGRKSFFLASTVMKRLRMMQVLRITSIGLQALSPNRSRTATSPW